jgi:site-specific recombinase XerD
MIGRYIKHITDFLECAEGINRRGYLLYKKENIDVMVRHSEMCDAICDLLSFLKIGYNRKEKQLKPLEKLNAISAKNQGILNDFIFYLTDNNDYSRHTIELYHTSIKKYFEYANEITAENYKRFVKMLEDEKFAPQTICLRITALEKLAEYVKKPIKLKRPKVRRSLDVNNVPMEAEYNRLLEYLSTKSNKDYYFFIKVLGTTGARASEFQQFTWENILTGEVTLKGKGNKYRRFFFQKQLISEAKEYAELNGKSGLLAVGRFGALTQKGFSTLLKDWGKHCGIDKKKMHAHAFRHFFAKMFLKKNKDIIQLADLLGHGSIDTTRIYLQRSYNEQKRDFNKNVTW